MDYSKVFRFFGISTIVAFILAGGTFALHLESTPVGAGLILLTGAVYFLIILGCVIIPLVPNID